MQAVQHSLAHRAQPATRSLRWQPYGSHSTVPGATQVASGIHPAQHNLTRSPTTNVTYLPTPHSPTINQYDCALPPPSNLLASMKGQSSLMASKDSNSHKRHLADQAASSLCDIWRTQDIPSVFLVPPTIHSPNSAIADQRHLSPLAPSSLYPSPPSSNHGSSPTTSLPIPCNQNTAPLGAALTSTKSFVYEVLRRSKTSSSVLGTALCYLEAIRGQVSTLQQREKTGTAQQYSNADQGSSIVCFDDLDEEEKQKIRQLEAEEATDYADYSGQDIATVRVIEDASLPGPVGSFSIPMFAQPPPAVVCASVALTPSSIPTVAADQSKSIIQSSSYLPSPLLCPRRSFLAALILATKFSQDRCYSNKAWAKLSGLPPREIGRCERALGQALDWRLWVGKGDAPETEGSSAERAGAKISRSLSPNSVGTDSKTVEMPVARRSAGLRKAQSQIFNPSATSFEGLRSIKRRHSPPAVLPRAYALAANDYVPWRPPHLHLSALATQGACSPMSTTSTPTLTHSPSTTEGSSGNDDCISESDVPIVSSKNGKYWPQVSLESHLLDQGVGLSYGHEGLIGMYREVY